MPVDRNDAEQLLERFLAGRTARTFYAYSSDLDDFARVRRRSREEAITQLLSEGPEAAQRCALEYADELRERSLAPATVERRVGTLRSLVRFARQQGVVQWSLEMPEQVPAGSPQEDSAADEVAYVLPRHPSEVYRLDLQHYALREKLGANYLAPVTSPHLVLDVGCGSGQWAFDLCREFPRALVVGLDLEPGKAGEPANYRFVRANLLHGLPFDDGRFDFVHQRLLFPGVPVDRWFGVMQDLVRVTRPGGWIELVEGANQPEPAGPATQRLAELLNRISRAAGIDSTGAIFRSLDEHLTRAGAVDVTRCTVELPLGEWGGRVGSFMASDGRALYSRLAPVFQARFGVPVEECLDLVAGAGQEWERNSTTYSFAIAYGRRPD